MPTTSMQRKLDMYEFLLDFIAHEIRNPLNSIIMFGNLLTEGAYGAVPPKQADVLGRVLASAYRIEHMTGGTSRIVRLWRHSSMPASIRIAPARASAV